MKSSVAVCVPTAGRPEAVKRVLASVAQQELLPAAVLVVDSSNDDATETVCSEVSSHFPSGILRHERSLPGLTRQRRHGVSLLRADEGIRYVCMLDDDVTIAPDFLAVTVAFLESAQGQPFGGVSGYDLRGWGRPFDRLDRLYARLGVYDGALRPGRWLYCGRFLELSRLSAFHGLHQSEFLGGGLTIWRMDVFEHFLPPSIMDGYALLEDKHLSLRVATRFRLGVLGQAHVWHDRYEGGRPRRFAMGYGQIRREALLLRDCDPSPSWLRYVVFLVFTFGDLMLQTVANLLTLRRDALPRLLGRAAGWVACVVRPPPASQDALVPSGRGQRVNRRLGEAPVRRR